MRQWQTGQQPQLKVVNLKHDAFNALGSSSISFATLMPFPRSLEGF